MPDQDSARPCAPSHPALGPMQALRNPRELPRAGTVPTSVWDWKVTDRWRGAERAGGRSPASLQQHPEPGVMLATEQSKPVTTSCPGKLPPDPRSARRGDGASKKDLPDPCQWHLALWNVLWIKVHHVRSKKRWSAKAGTLPAFLFPACTDFLLPCRNPRVTFGH